MMVQKRHDFYYIITIIVLVLLCVFSMNRCSVLKSETSRLEDNITALVDTVSSYVSKNGKLIHEKDILIGDVKSLEKLNASLSEDIKMLKAKNADLLLQLQGNISMPQVDTIWQYDTIYFAHPIYQAFEFKNKYRYLSGTINGDSNKLSLNITTDEVYFTYTLSITDNKVKIISDNPYVKYDSITGIYDKRRPKRWSFGLQLGIGFGYDIITNHPFLGPYIGVGANYRF